MKLSDTRVLNGTAVTLGVFGLLFALGACQSSDRHIDQATSEKIRPSDVISPEMWPAFTQALHEYSVTVSNLSDEYRTHGLAGFAYFHARIGGTDEARRAINLAIRLHNREVPAMRQASSYEWLDVLLRVAEAQAKGGDLRGATRTLVAIRQTAARLSPDGDQDDYTRSIMSEAYARIGMFGHGLAEARSIADPLGQASVLIDVARAQSSADQRDTARQTFAEALMLLESTQEDFDTFRRTMLRLVDAMLENEFFETALAAVSRIEHSLVRYEALGKLIRAQLQSGRVDEALSALDYYSYDGWTSPFFQETAQALLADRPVSEALEAARDIKELQPRVVILLEIARAWAKSGEPARARRLLGEVETTLVDQDEKPPSNGLYAKLAKAQADTGLIRESLATAAKIQDAWELKAALMTIGEGLATMGTVEQRDEHLAGLIPLAQAIQINLHRTEVLTSIAYSLAKVGSVSHSRNAADRIADRDDRLRALAGVAARLVESVGKDKANEVFLSALTDAQAVPASPGRDRYLADIALAQAEAALWANALQTASSIDNIGLRLITKTSVSRRMIGFQDRHAAAQVLAELRDHVRLVEAPDQRDRMFHGIALAYAEAGLWNDARQSADRISSSDDLIRTMTLILELMAESDFGEIGDTIFGDVLGRVLTMEAGFLRDRALVRMADIGIKAGLAEQIMGINASIEDITKQVEMLCKLGRWYARSGRFDDARNVLNDGLRFSPESYDESSMDWAWVSLADTQLDLGFYAEAVGTIGKIEDRLKRAVELERLLLFMLGEREDSATDIQESE